jgi:hypothetical protein
MDSTNGVRYTNQSPAAPQIYVSVYVRREFELAARDLKRDPRETGSTDGTSREVRISIG